MHEKLNLTEEEVIARADELIPGVTDGKKHKVSEIVFEKELVI